MCGINGFNFVDSGLINEMNKTIAHRGPDGQHTVTIDGVSLGHTRLSILDMRAIADQPMWSTNQQYCIVFNGEIYNYQELRQILESTYSFKTNGDTEVILAAYQQWGKECVTRFNGIFAFAIWNRERKEFFLARDHMGVKPLYYYLKDNIFIFSSEIKSILNYHIPRILNKEAFHHYVRVGYTPEPFTLFQDIYKLPQASYAIVKNHDMQISSYWTSETIPTRKWDRYELKQAIEHTVDGAVQRQLVSDRPVGLYLSGGVDSSILLDATSKVHGQVNTFTIGFLLENKDEEKKFNDDFYLARRTAYQYGAHHHELFITAQDVFDSLESAVWHLDEPIANTTILPMYCLSRFSKPYVDVILGGDGGDELFGGYERYRFSAIASMYQRVVPRIFRKGFIQNYADIFKKLNVSPGIDRYAQFLFLKDHVVRNVVSEEFYSADITKNYYKEKFFSREHGEHFESTFMDVDRRAWLVDESLSRTDKMSMAHGIEARVPFLDRELVELVYSIPLSYKVNMFHKKIILKEAFRHRLPPYLFQQPKRGWFSPGAKWLRENTLTGYFSEILSPTYYPPTNELFRWPVVENMLAKHRQKKEYHMDMLWMLILFQMWAKKYSIQI